MDLNERKVALAAYPPCFTGEHALQAVAWNTPVAVAWFTPSLYSYRRS
jgi:hypothetical protein